MMNIQEIRGALAWGYCSDGQTHKTMDPDLCEAQAKEIILYLCGASHRRQTAMPE